MAKTVGIGIQSFDKVIEGNYYYIDKTHFMMLGSKGLLTP